MPKVLKIDAVKKACQSGNALACQLNLRFTSEMYATSYLSFSDISLDNGNPNQMPVAGVLLLVDEASNKPPHGSRGHRIFVPKKVAEHRLDGLIGQGLNYSRDMESHAPQQKVGVITKAWLDGNKVRIKGIVYKKDFPEVEQKFKQGRLGMSMELANVYVRDENADVWYLEDFHFTGAAILARDAAAYTQTSLTAAGIRTALAAKASNQRIAAGGRKEGAKMPKPKEKEHRAGGNGSQLELLTKALSRSLRQELAPVVEGLSASADGIASLRDEMTDMKQLFEISAAAKREDDDDDSEEMEAARREDDDDDDDESMEAKSEEDDDDDMEAKGKKEDDEEEDDDDDDDDKDAMEAMEDLEEEEAEEEPGEVNKTRGDKNKGRKTTVTAKPTQGAHFGGSIADKRLSSAAMKAKKMNAGKPFPNLKSSSSIQAAAFIGDLQAQTRQLKKELKLANVRAAKQDKKINRFKTKFETMEAQMSRFAEQEGPRRLPIDIRNIAAKSNLDLVELQASGQKLSVAQVDQVLQNSGLGLDPVQSMTLKNKFLEYDLMEQGEVRRVQ